MAATILPIEGDSKMEQGVTWKWGLGWYDSDSDIRDLSSGWTARMSVAEKYNGDELLEADHSDGITLSDGTSGINIAIELAPAKTDLLVEERCYYILELTRTSDGEVFRLYEGEVEVKLDTPGV